MIKNRNNTLFYLLLMLVIAVAYILLLIYLADPCFCQGSEGNVDDALTPSQQVHPVQEGMASLASLDSLKTNLVGDTVQYKEAYRQYINYSSLLEEGTKRIDIDISIIRILEDFKKTTLTYVTEDLKKIRYTEGKIKIIDPSFKSSIALKWFEFD